MGYYGGLTIVGADERVYLGTNATAIGDINGDGIDDFAVATNNVAYGGSANGIYVIFGSDGPLPTEIRTDQLDGKNGFKIDVNLGGFYGETYNFGSILTNVGDLNGDGVDDLGIGGATVDYDSYNTAPTAFVLFGDSAGFDANVEVGTYMDAADGFGIVSDPGTFVSALEAAGDINGDGIDDLLVNQFQPTPYYGYYYYEGPGGYGYGPQVLSDNGVVGRAAGPQSFNSASSTPNPVNPNVAYVIFGDAVDDAVADDDAIAPTGLIDVADIDGVNGFGIEGGSGGLSGYYGEIYYAGATGGVVALGDVDGDGFDDLGLQRLSIDRGTVPTYDQYGNYDGPQYFINVDSDTFVLFGDDNSAAFPVRTGAANGQQVFWDSLSTQNTYDNRNEIRAGEVQVAALGDINGDGYDDVAISATNRVLLGEFNPNAENDDDDAFGVVGIIYGGPDDVDPNGDNATNGLQQNVNLASRNQAGELINEPDILIVNSVGGQNGNGNFGESISAAGDVNGDGLADFLISNVSAPGGQYGDQGYYGQTFLMFGQAADASSESPVILDLDALSQPEIDDTFYRFAQNTSQFSGFAQVAKAAGDINGDGFDDILITQSRADVPGAGDTTFGFNTGKTYVVFGGIDNLEAVDNADGTDDNQIDIVNLPVDVETGVLPIVVSVDTSGFTVQRSEGDVGSTVFSFNVLRTGDFTEEVSFDFAVTGAGFAPADADDFVGGTLPTGSATFASGSSVTTVDIEVSGDFEIENNEDFAFTISNVTTDGPSPISIGADSTLGRIRNDDQPAFIRIGDATADESGQLVFNVTRFGDLSSAVTVDFSVVGAGFASVSAADIAGGDADGVALPAGLGQTGQLSFAANETIKQITLIPVDDQIIEGQERVEVGLSLNTSDGTVVLSDGLGLGRINDNDFAPEILVTGTRTLLEGSGGGFTPVEFSFIRRGDTSGVTEVTYDLNPLPTQGSFFAADGQDIDSFLPSFGNVVRFEDGESVKIVTVNIIRDGIIEPREQFEARITEVETFNGVDYDIVGTNARITILNDDGRPAVIPPGVEADVFGDPHIVTLDGLGYDFQAVGEFVLVESTIEDDPRDFSVQVRFEPLSGSDLVSVTTRMAVNVGDDIVEIDALGPNPILINGEVPTAEQLETLFIDLNNDGLQDIEFNEDLSEFTIYLNDLNEQLKIKNMDGVLNVCVFLSDAEGGHAGNVIGLMGNANGDRSDDLMTRDGAQTFTDPSFDDLYVTYADSWAVTEDERNFSDETTAGNFPADFPAAKIGVDDLPPSVRLNAETAVLEAGIAQFEADGETPNPLFDAAVLDFALTGDADFIAGVLGLAADPEEEVEVTDAPVVPLSVGVTPVDTRVSEADGDPNSVFFTFYRLGDTTDAVTIDYAIGGDVDAADLAAGTDLTGQVTIPAGETEISLVVDVVNDTMTELDEALTVTITGNDAGALVAGVSGTTIIETDDFAPDAVDDTFSGASNGSLNGNVLDGNPTDADSDADGDTLTVVSAQNSNGGSFSIGSNTILPSGATLLVSSDGTFTYNPFGFNTTITDFEALAGGEIGTETFTYSVSDGNGGLDTAEVTINVTGVDDAPIAALDQYTPTEDETVSGNMITDSTAGRTDVDPEGGALTVTKINNVLLADLDEDAGTDGTQISLGIDGGNGQLTVFSNGDFFYDTDGQFENLGSAFPQLVARLVSVQYTIEDDTGLENSTSLRFFVQGVNDGPTASGDDAETAFETAVIINVLENDTDPEGDDLIVTDATSDFGDVVIGDDGSITFTPMEGFSGPATISYTIEDQGGETSSTEVTVTVGDAPNQAPVATDDDFETDEDTIVTGNLLANDEDDGGDAPLTIARVLTAAGQEIELGVETELDEGGTILVEEDGSVTFNPTDDYEALGFNPQPEPPAAFVQLSYVATDGELESEPATAIINIRGVNDGPDAVDDMFDVDEDVATVIDFLGNDTDPEDDLLDATIMTGPANGTVELVDGAWVYQSNENYFGPDSFTYSISDGALMDAATVSITVAPINDDPDANDDMATVVSGNTLFLSAAFLLDNDTDVDGDTLTLTGSGAVTAGEGAITASDGAGITYDPQDFVGVTSFTYSISDGNGGTDTGTIQVTVDEAPNEAPNFDEFEFVFNVDENTTDVGTTGATDPEDDTLTYSISGEDAEFFDINEVTGAIAFKVAPDFESGDTQFMFEVSVSDGDLSDTASVTVNVQDVDEGPALNEVIGTNGVDRLVGTDEADRIDMLAGRIDFGTGGAGADVFDFTSSSSNGLRERKIITDFDVTEDSLEFGDAEIVNVRSAGGRTFIDLDGDMDQIILLGVSNFGTDFLA